jgi:hypothetical protein
VGSGLGKVRRWEGGRTPTTVEVVRNWGGGVTQAAGQLWAHLLWKY